MLTMMYHIFLDPFLNYGFMRRAIVACFILSVSTTPLGNFLMFRRMSLIGDALSHAILPGVAIGYIFSNMSLIFMSIGGFISGLTVAILSSWISEKTFLRQDASLSGFYLGFLAFGIILLSLLKISDLELLNLLFGSILNLSILHLKFIGVISTVTVFSIAILYRALIIEIFDPVFLKSNFYNISRLIHLFFLLIVVLNLIANLYITGTLMSLGLMILPGLSARFWVKSLINIFLLSILIALLCSWIGLLITFYMSLPAGPTIILCMTIFFCVSIVFGINRGIIFLIFFNK